MPNYRSGFERTLAVQLKRSGVGFEYETLALPYTIDHVYNPDFILSNGIIIEAKGLLDVPTRQKMLAVKKAHPELDIRFVFMSGQNKLNKRSRTTYLDWARKNGFPAADGKVPDEWLK
jgi:hypothetical protein